MRWMIHLGCLANIYVMNSWHLLLCHLVGWPKWASVGTVLYPLSGSVVVLIIIRWFCDCFRLLTLLSFNFSLLFFFSPSLFLAVQLVPPQYLCPVISLLSCFSVMQNIVVASFCVPLLRNNLLSLIHSTAQSSLVGPLSGSFTRIGLSPFGSRSHSILCIMVSLDVSASGSQIGSRKHSGIMSWTMAWCLPLISCEMSQCWLFYWLKKDWQQLSTCVHELLKGGWIIK